MTFFLDNNISRHFETIFQILGKEVVHLQSHFSPDTPDVDWIPEIGARGWVVISCDERICSHPPERKAMAASGLKVIFMPARFTDMGRFEQAKWLINNWQKIEACAAILRPGVQVRFSKDGSHHQLSIPSG